MLQEDGQVSPVDLEQCVLEMFLAGTDTSSVTMYYTLVALSDNPDIEGRILEEIDRVVGNKQRQYNACLTYDSTRNNIDVFP